MAKVKYDVTGVESGQDFDTPVPVGLYRAKVAEAVLGVSQSSGNEMITVTYQIVHGEWKNRNLWDYITLTDTQEWKMRQFLEAIGKVNGKKGEKGSLDLDAIVGTVVQVKVRHQTSEEFGTRAKVGSVVKLPEDEDAADLDDEDEPQAAVDDEDEGTEEDLTLEDLEGYDRDELETLIEDNELDVSYNKRTSEDTLRERIAEELELEAEASEPEDEDEAPDYSEYSVPDLKSELKERGLSTAGTKKTLIKKLEKSDMDDEPF